MEKSTLLFRKINVIEFYKIYKKYIDDIVKFINRK